MTDDAPTTDSAAAPETGCVLLSVVDAQLIAHTPPDATGAAELSWSDPSITVMHLGVKVEGGMNCTIAPGQTVVATVADAQPRTDYVVTVSPDRMEATMRVRQQPGRSRRLAEAEWSRQLRLRVEETQLEAEPPNDTDAMAALLEAGVTWGVDREAVAQAVAEPGSEVVIAVGREAVPGRNGYVQPMLDFEQVRTTGVPAETPLLRRVRKRDGTSGMTVLGKEMAVRPVRDARFRLGEGVGTDEAETIAYATRDGLPVWDGDCHVEVKEELVLDNVGLGTGDIDFLGSVRVRGDVMEGRRVRAAHELAVEGNVDRAHLESGGSMIVGGTIMSSVLRAGGERAVAASIIDLVSGVPTMLAEAATRASELRDGAEKRGTELSHGLSIQLVLERMYRSLLTNLAAAAEALRESGPEHSVLADEFSDWQRKLATAAVTNLGAEAFMRILDDASKRVDQLRRAVEQHSDLTVSYMQASEAEATGMVTLNGKGIFNSSITAWKGLIAEDDDAVVRGGSITSHGPVKVAEIGSPGGSTMRVQLGKEATVEAKIVYAGTLLAAPGNAHRFIADRSHVKVDFSNGGMNVDSLAA